MTCGTCRYWRRQHPARDGRSWGDCKRFPPAAHAGGTAPPRVASDDWCGEHAPPSAYDPKCHAAMAI